MYYHATYKPLLKSIVENGLGQTERTNWPDSDPSIVYLANSPSEAYAFAETCERVPEEWTNQIVVLTIPETELDQNKISADKANLDNNTTKEYEGIIPPRTIGIHSITDQPEACKDILKLN